MRVFLAGATGAIGRRLIPLLHSAGYTVVGTTRDPAKVEELRRQNVEPVVVDMFDEPAVREAVRVARADFLVHQLTDLPKVFDAAAMEKARVRNARLREVATPALMNAARDAGIRRAVVQSICFAYTPGATPFDESHPIAAPSVQTLENATLQTPDVEGVVLRYGRLWGPGTWSPKPDGSAAPLHVDAAAHAALLALTRGAPGVYNIAEDDGTVSVVKARQQLGFNPSFRLAENGGASR